MESGEHEDPFGTRGKTYYVPRMCCARATCRAREHVTGKKKLEQEARYQAISSQTERRRRLWIFMELS